MLKILKNFFNDNNTKIGLSGFNLPKHVPRKLTAEIFFTDTCFEKSFKTDFEKNILLI